MDTRELSYQVSRPFPVSLLLLLTILLLLVPAISPATQVRLSWAPNTEPDLAGYKVYYGPASGYYPYSIDVGNKTSTQISSLDEGSNYFFSLKAYDQVGNYSSFSQEITITIPIPDTDRDGISDSDEIKIYLTSPADPDSDNDGMNDGAELVYWGPSWSEDIDQDGLINLLDDDSDGDYVRDGQEYAAGTDPAAPDLRNLPMLEIKTVDMNHTWRRVSFSGVHVEPVVVAGPSSTITNPGEPAVIRIQNVDASGFDSMVQEWDYLDGRRRLEKIQYLILDRGRFVLPDSVQIEADVVSCTGLPSSPQAIRFSRPFAVTPLVLAAVTSMNGAEAVTVRLLNVTTEGFTACLQEQESNAQDHISESVSYIAWEPSAGMIEGLAYEVGTPTITVTQNPSLMYFAESFSAIPFFFPSLQTVNEDDPGTVELYRIGTARVSICVREEKSLESDTRHVPESVGYLAIGSGYQ